MPKFDVSQMMVEAALTKAIKDLKTDPETTVKKWLEKKGNHGKGNFQQAVLSQIKTMLQDPTSAYHILIKRLVTNVEAENLKTFALNFGYHGCTAGTKTIRSQELVYDVHIPWTVSFEMDGVVTVNQVGSVIEQAKKLGIHIFQIHCRTEQRVYDLPQLFVQHSDCAFVVYVRPEAINALLIEQFGRCKNFLLAVSCCERDADEEFALLKKGGFLYAAHYEYDASNAKALFVGEYLEYAANVGAIFAFAWPKKGTQLQMQNEVYNYMLFKKLEQRLPVIPIEVIKDTLNMDRLLSDEATFLYFNGDGQRIRVEADFEKTEENLFKQSFLQILEAL